MSAQHGATVRHARREDVPHILSLIHDLAAYEKEPPSTVEATAESLAATVAFAPSDPTSTTTSMHTLRTADASSILPDTEPITPSRPARCLLLFPRGADEPAGMALYFYNYSTWRARAGIYLEDLFVREGQRGRGFGTRLLVALAREVVAMEGGRLEWSVLKWNEPSIKFYEGLGARMMSEWVGMRVDGEALVKLAATQI